MLTSPYRSTSVTLVYLRRNAPVHLRRNDPVHLRRDLLVQYQP